MPDDSHATAGSAVVVGWFRERVPDAASPVWQILCVLAATPEPELRRVLRSHEDAGFSLSVDGAVIQQRDELDHALDALTLLEIGYQVGFVHPSAHPIPQLDALRVLFGSEAFYRFLSVYLYFGVRFLASRVVQPPWRHTIDEEERRADPQPEPSLLYNDPVLPLMTPPSLSTTPTIQERGVEAWDKASDLQKSNQAFRFLDGYKVEGEERTLELWLRGLRPDVSGDQQARYVEIVEGMRRWTLERAELLFWLEARSVDREDPEESRRALRRAPGALSPFASRFNLAGIYWISRLLRVDVDSLGRVLQRGTSWIALVAMRDDLGRDHEAATRLRAAEVQLRSALAQTCDLVQNAAELTLVEQRRHAEPHRSATNSSGVRVDARAVMDRESEAIFAQRQLRSVQAASQLPAASGSTQADTARARGHWSTRHRTGFALDDTVGLAFSGGGVRSATFNLGVLQGLQELDLLNWVDYLSTVSGGGFIGAWLAGNVRRSWHWLSKHNSWAPSVAHLRAYANYLTPRSGILSGDTWSLGALWLRNATLIQLTGLAWLLTILLAVVLLRVGFAAAASSFAVTYAHWWQYPLQVAGFAAASVVALVLLLNIAGSTAARQQEGQKPRRGWLPSSTHAVHLLGVAPAWLGAWIVGSYLFHVASVWETRTATFGTLFKTAYPQWMHLLEFSLAAFFLLACLSVLRSRLDALASQSARDQVTSSYQNVKAVALAVGLAGTIACVCVLVLDLCLCGVLLGLLRAASMGPNWTVLLAFVVSPAAVLASFSAAVLLLVGLSGRFSNEAQREWWTRYAAWVMLYAGGGLMLSAMVLLGPRLVSLLVLWMHGSWKAVKFTAVLGWFGSIVGGLVAGRSSKTAGDNPSKSTLLELLANLGGLLFILTAVQSAATLLYLFLRSWQSPAAPAFVLYPDRVAHYDVTVVLWSFGCMLVCGLVFSLLFEINIFGINQLYRNRLVRCYLGATRWMPGLRQTQPFTTFDFNDDLDLADLQGDDFRGPFPLLNCSLNLSGSPEVALNTRHSASFTISPLFCGADRERVGYAPTVQGENRYAGGVRLGQAVSVSGAAASPNMGYNTRPLAAFLLTMFNVRLGWWFPNPDGKKWRSRGLNFSLYYLLTELLGLANDSRDYLNVSDGGHFENLGIYELVRRRCKVIIASDAECDEELAFGGLGNVIRLCETDFGAVIDIDVSSLRKGDGAQRDADHSRSHCAVGTIRYSNGATGRLIYLKAVLTGDEEPSVQQYHASHPSFPHQSTANQFYTEDQFESYRRLGLHTVRMSFRGVAEGERLVEAAERMADMLVPASNSVEATLRHTRNLDALWQRLRVLPETSSFFAELMDGVAPKAPLQALSEDERCVGLEVLRLMEEVFVDLHLDDFWEHPDNRGWAMLFMSWARSPRLRQLWKEQRQTFGIRFEYFCASVLGLPLERPIQRVRPLVRSL